LRKLALTGIKHCGDCIGGQALSLLTGLSSRSTLSQQNSRPDLFIRHLGDRWLTVGHLNRSTADVTTALAERAGDQLPLPGSTERPLVADCCRAYTNLNRCFQTSRVRSDFGYDTLCVRASWSIRRPVGDCLMLGRGNGESTSGSPPDELCNRQTSKQTASAQWPATRCGDRLLFRATLLFGTDAGCSMGPFNMVSLAMVPK
jgi:hypothetical protein